MMSIILNVVECVRVGVLCVCVCVCVQIILLESILENNISQTAFFFGEFDKLWAFKIK